MVDYGQLTLTALTNLAVDIPLFIVWLVGIIIAIVRWKKSPRTSLFTILGLLIIAFVRVILSTFAAFFPMIAYNNGMLTDSIGTTFTIVNIIGILIETGGWVLLLLAIFGSKTKKTETI